MDKIASEDMMKEKYHLVWKTKEGNKNADWWGVD